MGFVVYMISADYFSYVRVVMWAPVYRPTGANRGYLFIFSVHISLTVLIFFKLAIFLAREREEADSC